MLVHLHVRNLALIEDIEVEFGPGLNILTGETGAGKSILLGKAGQDKSRQRSRKRKSLLSSACLCCVWQYLLAYTQSAEILFRRMSKDKP